MKARFRLPVHSGCAAHGSHPDMRITVTAASFAIFLLALLILTAWAVSPNLKPPLTLNEANNGQEVNLVTGQKFDVELDENATTGYRWNILSPGRTVIRETDEPDFRRGSDAIGAGGKRTFHFIAASTGIASLKLTYRRSWEKDVPPAKTFQVTVKVR